MRERHRRFLAWPPNYPDMSIYTKDREEGKLLQVSLSVAFEGAVGDWAAYEEILGNQQRIFPHHEKVGEPATLHEAIHTVMTAGQKLYVKDAERMFPGMAQKFEWRS